MGLDQVLKDLRAQRGTQEETFASQEQGVPQKTQAQLDREAYVRELRETAWAAYHLNFPENKRGFGPWANEQISFSEARKGSILGLGFVDNPFSQTEAETRALSAKGRNGVRRQVRDAFNAGASFETLKGIVSAANFDTQPDDLRRHYGLTSA